MTRAEPWKRNPGYVIDFLYEVKAGDVLHFGGDGSPIVAPCDIPGFTAVFP